MPPNYASEIIHTFTTSNDHDTLSYSRSQCLPKRLDTITHLQLSIKAIKSARSLSFLMPAKTIFVPGMYFLGLIKYSKRCLSDQMIPEFLFASEYAKPSTVPEWRPIRP